MSYPLLNVFWTMFEFFAWVAWIWLLIYVCMDIFRSRDLSGGSKALWFVFVFFIPVIGLLAYLIVRGGDMHERTLEQRVPRQYRYGDVGSSYAPADPAAPGAKRRQALPRISSRVLLTPVTGGRSRRRSSSARRQKSLARKRKHVVPRWRWCRRA